MRRTLSILCERKMFWRILKFAMNSYSCFAFIFTRVIGTSPGYSDGSLSRLPTRRSREGERTRRLTKDRVHNLAVRATGAALLDLGVVDLEEVVEPGNELGAGLSHREDA